MKNKNRKYEITFYDEDLHDDEAMFSVIVSQYKNRWVFCRHEARTTLEVPGGHIEQGETPDEAANRELYEETGAVSYDLKRIKTYGVKIDGKINYGVLYYADILELGSLPDSEIAEISLHDDFPVNLTYPHIQPYLFRFVDNYLKKQKLSKNYKAVFFDLDGTIFDNFGALDKAVEQLYDTTSIFHIFEFDKFKKLYVNLQDKYFNMFKAKELTWKQQRTYRMKSLYSHFGVSLGYDEAYEKFLEFLELFESHWALLDNAYELLTGLKKAGYKIGMVTNGEINQQIKKMDSQNITGFFDCIIASSEYDFAKPEKKIFDLALEKLDIAREEAIFAGDSIRSDICGAHNAQIDSVFTLREHNEHYSIDCKPTYTIYDLDELYFILDLKREMKR